MVDYVKPVYDHPGLKDSTKWSFMQSVNVGPDYRFEDINKGDPG